jgi:hypothetical protein
VPVDVVHALEVVDIHHQKRDRIARSARAVQLRPQPLVEVPVVVEAREGIGLRLVLEVGADLRVVERERGGVSEGLRQLELVLDEASVLSEAVDVQHPLERPACDQRDGDQRLRVGRSARNEMDSRVEVRGVRQHRLAPLGRPPGDALAEARAVAEDLLLPRLRPHEHRHELAPRLVRLVDGQRVVRDELGDGIGDPFEHRFEALLREHLMEHLRKLPVRGDEGVPACVGSLQERRPTQRHSRLRAAWPDHVVAVIGMLGGRLSRNGALQRAFLAVPVVETLESRDHAAGAEVQLVRTRGVLDVAGVAST